jgi:addiction module HigA family antidote
MPKSVQHPGVLVKSLLGEYQLSPAKLAADISLSQSSIRLLINGKLRISTAIALRLSKYFGNTAEYWIDLQNQYDLVEIAKDSELSAILKAIPKAKKQVKAPAKKVGKAARGPKTAKKAGRKPRTSK